MAFRSAWSLVFFLGVVLSAFVFQCAESKYIKYNTTSTIVPGKLNVHLVAHSHDDVGWLKTIDQYYVGSNNTIKVPSLSLLLLLILNKNHNFTSFFLLCLKIDTSCRELCSAVAIEFKSPTSCYSN